MMGELKDKFGVIDVPNDAVQSPPEQSEEKPIESLPGQIPEQPTEKPTKKPAKKSVEKQPEQPSKDDDEDSASLVTFKRVVRGFHPGQVNEYIELINTNLSNAQRVFDEQSRELKNQSAFIARENEKLREQQAAMIEKVEAYEKKCEECKAAIEERNALAAEKAQLQEQVRSLFTKLEACKNLAEDNRRLKAQAAQIEVERKHMQQQKATMSEEIAALRTQNADQAHNFAEQKKDIEQQFTNELLRRAELLQVHTYHMDKSEELLSEVIKQFSQAKKSLDDINRN